MQNMPETARNVDRVLLAAPRGFCAGVEMAIKALAWMVRTFPAPVYCYHEIVHNRAVVDRFLKLVSFLLTTFQRFHWACPSCFRLTDPLLR